MTTKVPKVDPFIRKCLGSKYTHLPFDKLSVSTTTINAKLGPNTGLRYEDLFELIHIEENKTWEDKLPPGSIFGGRCGNKVRGTPPTVSKTSLRNSMMLWIWLEDKYVNLKVSRNGVHITGCKLADHASEALRWLQMHIELLHSPTLPLYNEYPTVIDFDIHMISYNFSTEVALDLVFLDTYINKNCRSDAYSSYDKNVTPTSMVLKLPNVNMTLTINDNGQISMCTGGSSFELVSQNVCEGYAFFYDLLTRVRLVSI